MRSTLIIAYLAATLSAAPVPSPENDALARREYAGPVETMMDKIYVREAEAEPVKFNQRTPGNLRGGYRREADAEAEPIKFNQREAEAAPGNLRGNYRRDAEAEAAPGNLRGSYRRDAEAEAAPGNLRGNYRRDAEAEAAPGNLRGGYRRGAEAEPVFSRPGNRREAEAEAEAAPGNLRGGYRREAKSAIRTVYEGVVGAIETLKTRGFNSGAVLPVRQPM